VRNDITYTIWRDTLTAYRNEAHNSYQLTKGDVVVPVGMCRFGMLPMVGVLFSGQLFFVPESEFNHVCAPIL